MTDTIPDVVPKNEYETTDGTPAVEHGTHEPRTIVRTNTTGDEVSTYMMSEIGDGVFVQWSQCATCSSGVATCTCTDGPQEPAYITKWRDARFERSLNTRPEIEFTALPGVVKHLKKQGYTVLTKDELAEYVALKTGETQQEAVREDALREIAPDEYAPEDF
jgi:hypothetical protein